MIQVNDSFHKHAAGQVIIPKTELRISFTRNASEDLKYFTLDDSVLDGPDLLAPDWTNPIQSWDAYTYNDYTGRLVSAEWSRSVEFPYGVQTAMADITVDNTDGYFTPGSGSTISAYNYPKRPVRILAGFEGEGVVEQFVGLTQGMPAVDNNARTVGYHMQDFLSEIADMNLNQIIVGRDLRTDQVLKLIFDQFGVRETQEDFEQGANTIPFVFFDIGENAGDVIRKLIQAEGGRLWLDEQGIIKFQARRQYSEEPVFTFNAYQVLDMAPASDTAIINHLRIEADVREVQEFQTVYTKASSASSTQADSLWVIEPGQSITRELSLSDPCLSVVLPTQGKNSDVSWFTTKTSAGVTVDRGVTATGTLSSNAYTITFTNTYGQALEIDEMSLWGEPAKVVDHINYDTRDTYSEARFGEQLMEITDNQFFQSYEQVEDYAQFILSGHADYGATYEATVKGDFSLQLGDMVQFESDTTTPGIFVVEAISYVLGPGSMQTTLKLHPLHFVRTFILDESKIVNTKLDEGDVLA